MKVKFPEWVQSEAIVKRDGEVGYSELFPGDVVTLKPGDYMRIGDAVLNVHRDVTVSLYPASQAKVTKPRAERELPEGVERPGVGARAWAGTTRSAKTAGLGL